jgi:hypothetical protein
MQIRKNVDGFIRALALSACLVATAANTPLAAAQAAAAAPHALVSTVARSARCRADQAAKRPGDDACILLSASTSSAKPQGYLWGIRIPFTNGYLWNV